VAACLGYGDSSSDFSSGRELIRREIAVDWWQFSGEEGGGKEEETVGKRRA
jgi:hypothetical protein